MKVKLLTPIEGYEDVAEWRHPQQGEYYLNPTESRPTKSLTNFTHVCYLVLTPIKRWRPATIDDAIRAAKGERIAARFRDNDAYSWRECVLTGLLWHSKNKCWYSMGGGYNDCEVLDA